MNIRISRLKEVVGICETLHERCNSAAISSERIYYAAAFFRKCTLHARSLCSLVQPLKSGREPDLAGICALARSIIEVHNVFVYITEHRLSLAEREFRLKLMLLNQAVDLVRISQALGVASDDLRIWTQRTSIDYVLDQLQTNPAFLALNELQRTHMLKGRTPYLMERYRGLRPVNREIESAAYNLFSHNVHSYGLSTGHHGGATPAGFINLLFLAVELSLIFVSHVAKRYQSIRGRATGAMALSDAAVIEEVLTLQYFNAWKEQLGKDDMLE